MNPPLTLQQRRILQLVASQPQPLYAFLDSGCISSYQESKMAIAPLIQQKWIACIWGEENAFLYRLTELGRECLRLGCQLDQIPDSRPFWMRSQ